MKFLALVRSVCARPTLREVIGPLHVRYFQPVRIQELYSGGGVEGSAPCRFVISSTMILFPEIPRPSLKSTNIQLSTIHMGLDFHPPTRSLNLQSELLPYRRRRDLKLISPTLGFKLNHPKLEKISVEGLDLSVQGGVDAGAAKVEEKKEKTAFDVKLEKFDASAKIKVIKEVRPYTNLGLKEAKDLVEKALVVLKQGVTKDEANGIIVKIIME